MTNRYPAACAECGSRVPARAGTLHKVGRIWIVKHLSCSDSNSPEVFEVRIGGNTYIRNRRGPCEDAPCCGCCTI